VPRQIAYEQMTPEQKLCAYWHDRCDADPVPPEFDQDMEAAGLIAFRAVTKRNVEESSFATELGIELGGYLWELTDAGRAALSEGASHEQ